MVDKRQLGLVDTLKKNGIPVIGHCAGSEESDGEVNITNELYIQVPYFDNDYYEYMIWRQTNNHGHIQLFESRSRNEIVKKLKKLLEKGLGNIKCPQCGGSGEYYSEGMARDHTITEGLKCDMCEGKGEIDE